MNKLLVWLSSFKVCANVPQVAVRFWNYGKLSCMSFISFFEKQITKIKWLPKWRQLAVGSSFSVVSVPQNEHKEKLNCLSWRSLSVENKLSDKKDIIYAKWSFTFKTPKPNCQLDKPLIIFESSC